MFSAPVRSSTVTSLSRDAGLINCSQVCRKKGIQPQTARKSPGWWLVLNANANRLNIFISSGWKLLYLNWIQLLGGIVCVCVTCPPNPQVRPLYELVKEVECAGVKKLHMRRALEEYLSAEQPCRCRPCQQGGQPLLLASQCVCVCRLGTSGVACQSGAAVGAEPGRKGLLAGSPSC